MPNGPTAVAGGMATDPALSAAGRARAASLAAMLKDTKLTAVFATEFKRTQETAAPTAAAQHVTVDDGARRPDRGAGREAQGGQRTPCWSSGTRTPCRR